MFHRHIGAESLRFRGSTVPAAGSDSRLNAWFGLLVGRSVGRSQAYRRKVLSAGRISTSIFRVVLDKSYRDKMEWICLSR